MRNQGLSMCAEYSESRLDLIESVVTWVINDFQMDWVALEWDFDSPGSRVPSEIVRRARHGSLNVRVPELSTDSLKWIAWAAPRSFSAEIYRLDSDVELWIDIADRSSIVVTGAPDEVDLIISTTALSCLCWEAC